MTKIIIFFVTMVCFGLSQPAYTKSPATEQGQHCSDAIVNFIGDQFALDYFSYPEDGNSPSVESGGLIVAGVCKAWPEGGSKTIAIFAYDEGKQSEKKTDCSVG